MDIPRTHEGTHAASPPGSSWRSVSLNLTFCVDIEAQIRDIQSKKKEAPPEGGEKGVSLAEGGFFDSEIYDGKDKKYEGYVTSIAANDEVDDEEEEVGYSAKRTGLGAPVALLNDIAQVGQRCLWAPSGFNGVLGFRAKKTMIRSRTGAGPRSPTARTSTGRSDAA